VIPLEAVRGQWVQIHKIILKPGERAPQVPEDTAEVPFELRVKGYLQDEKAVIGDLVTIKTPIGREVKGQLIDIEPRYTHDFGDHVSVLDEAGAELQELMRKISESDER